MRRPLNPRLYAALQARLPGGVRRVANPGESAATASPEIDLLGRTRSRLSRPGEQYVVRCPFCGDRSGHGHLYVSHLYGTPDPLGGDNTHRVRCFRRECQSDPDHLRHLQALLLGGLHTFGRVAVAEETPPEEAAVAPPDGIVPLVDLPEVHPALRYLRRRGYDPVALARDYGVAYGSSRAKESRVRGRLYLPLVQGGVYRGWQARLPYDPPKGGPAKYLFGRDTPRSRLLYNLDGASAGPLAVVVEGPTDVWTVGRSGVGLFGKSMTPHQEDLLVRHFGAKTTVVLLDADDPDAERFALDIEQRLARRATGVVLRIALPSGLDPGDCPRDVLWDYLRHSASLQGKALPSPLEPV